MGLFTDLSNGSVRSGFSLQDRISGARFNLPDCSDETTSFSTMDSVQMIAHIEKSLDYSVFDVKWIPCTAKFVVMGSKPKGTGILQIYELNRGELDKVREIEKPKSFKCCSFGASGLREKQLTTGDFVGKLAIYDVERLEQPIYEVSEAHAGIINSLDAIGGTTVNCGAPEIVTGGRDGSVKVWDPRQKDAPVAHISALGDGPAEKRDCWAVGFGDSFDSLERCVVSGYDNGDVKLIDLRVMKERWTTNVKNGVCGIEFDRKDIKMNKLVVTTLEGGLHVFDMRTQHSEKGFAQLTEKDAGQALGSNGVISGAKSTVWTVKHLPQNRDIFATCGGAGNIRVWLYHYPEKRTKSTSTGEEQGVVGSLEMLNATTISTQPVHTFDWSPDRQGLAVCGAFDQTIRVLVSTNLHLH